MARKTVITHLQIPVLLHVHPAMLGSLSRSMGVSLNRVHRSNPA